MSSQRLQTLGICAAIGLSALIGYWPVVHYPFVNWDDQAHVSERDEVRTGLTWENFKWSWGIHGPSQWHPLAWWSHQLDSQWYGTKSQEAAGGHHLTSLLLHVAASLALFGALRRLTSSTWPSALVAALFALHPVHVESVAWVSERRDVLSGLFAWLTLWAYAAYAQVGRVRSFTYALTLIFFALGLMAKPMLVTLPCVLLLLDFWPLRRFRNDSLAAAGSKTCSCPPRTAVELVIEKLPLFLLASISFWLSYLCQKEADAIRSWSEITLRTRIDNTILSYAYYLRNMAWPWNLSPIYPLKRDVSPWLVGGMAALLLLITTVAVIFRRRLPYLLVGWLWFLGTLLPVSALVRMGNDIAMADRYMYLSAVGVYLAVAWGLQNLSALRMSTRAVIIPCVITAFVACLLLTQRQVSFWENSVALWKRALSVEPHTLALVPNNLGCVIQGEALGELDPQRRAVRMDEAMQCFRDAIALDPRFADGHANLGNILVQLGRDDEAYGPLAQALDLNPKHPIAHFNMGVILQSQGNIDGAARHFQEAIRIKPQYADARNLWGTVLQNRGDFNGALAEFQEAIRLQPDLAEAHGNLGGLYGQLGMFDQAIVQLQLALKQKPGYAMAHCNLGTVLKQQGNLEAAIKHFKAALRLDPKLGLAHNNLGNALKAQGQLEAAILEFRKALQLEPNDSLAQENLRQTEELLKQRK